MFVDLMSFSEMDSHQREKTHVTTIQIISMITEQNQRMTSRDCRHKR